MSSSCPQIHAFADGELGAAEAEAFRDHLAMCRMCPGTLEDILALDGLAEEALVGPPRTIELDAFGDVSAKTDSPSATSPTHDDSSSGPGSGPSHKRGALHQIAAWFAGFGAGLALPIAGCAAIALYAWVRLGSPSDRVASLERPACRAIRGRIAYGDLAQAQPCPVLRAGASANAFVGPLTRQEVLAALEARGDRHGLGMAHLRDGDLTAAAKTLATAADAPEVMNDRAVVALERGDAASALTLSDAVLARLPDAPYARWNRAVALAELGRRAEAAAAFAAIASAGEPGWAAQARVQLEALRAEPLP